MRRKSSAGFTLIELMVVVLIIGIFAAIAIPQLVNNSRSNELTDMTNMVEQTFADARAQAMKTRRAITVEFDGNDIWVNRLAGANCWAAIEAYCVLDWGQERAGSTDPSILALDATKWADAKSYLCDATVSQISGSTCQDPIHFDPTAGAALCYSGNGDLWFRNSGDAASVCPTSASAGGATPADSSSWTRSCIVTATTGGNITENGAVLSLNRQETQIANDCAAGALDVVREVHIPFGGAPYSEVSK